MSDDHGCDSVGVLLEVVSQTIRHGPAGHRGQRAGALASLEPLHGHAQDRSQALDVRQSDVALPSNQSRDGRGIYPALGRDLLAALGARLYRLQ